MRQPRSRRRTEAEEAREQLTLLQARIDELEAERQQAQERATHAEGLVAEAEERIAAARAEADEGTRALLAQEQDRAQAQLAEVQSTMEQQVAAEQQRADGAVLEAAAAQEEVASLQPRISELESTVARTAGAGRRSRKRP